MLSSWLTDVVLLHSVAQNPESDDDRRQQAQAQLAERVEELASIGGALDGLVDDQRGRMLAALEQRRAMLDADAERLAAERRTNGDGGPGRKPAKRTRKRQAVK